MIKSKDVFMKDLEQLYKISADLNSDLQKFYTCFENSDSERCDIIDSFIDEIGFEKDTETRNVIIKKLVCLRNNDLEVICDKLKLSSESKANILFSANKWASKFHIQMFERGNFMAGQKGLLTDFYRELIIGHLHIGQSFTKLDVARDKHLFSINEKVLAKFDGNVSLGIKFIHENNLMDTLPDGARADRSYSMLVEDSFEECGFITESYGVFFKEIVDEICYRIKSLISVLNELEDYSFNAKHEWLEYFESLVVALSETRVENLIGVWRKVDFKWMKITTPIQVCHPFEYYDDKLRNSIEISWDLRLINPKRNDATSVKNNMSEMFESYMNENSRSSEFKDIYDTSNSGLNNVQLYIGKPYMYFADFFKGLFSAQVIPNDEYVSKITGKKIFGFADFINDVQVSSPTSKLSVEVFGKEFVSKVKNIAKNDIDKWHKIYSISTIGHEYGHILWKCGDSEVVMNESGNFKNIEEYKATTGGLVTFFKSSEVDTYWEELFYDIIGRAVKLIAWKKVESVCPYYCEGLIHLKGLFDAGVLKFDGSKLNIDLSRESFDKFSSWTISNYEDLIVVYLEKKDATVFLDNFAKFDNSSKVFMPVDSELCSFVNWYYDLYEKIGRENVKLD